MSIPKLHIYDGGEEAPESQRYLGKFFEGFTVHPRTGRPMAVWWPVTFHGPTPEGVRERCLEWAEAELAKAQRLAAHRAALKKYQKAQSKDKPE